jgi:hypothetical protein
VAAGFVRAGFRLNGTGSSPIARPRPDRRAREAQHRSEI